MTDLKDIINKYSDYQTDSNDGQTASPATEFSNLSIYANNDQEEEQQPNQFIAGLKSGIDKTQALGYGLLGVAAKDTGNYQFAERAFEGYQKNLKEASTRGVRESSFLDLMGDEKPLTPERATDYAASLMGDLAPTAATIAIPGGIVARGARFAVRAGAGGAIPFVEEAIKRIALQQTGKLVNKGVAKDVAEKEALEFAKNHVTKKAAEYGMYAGSGAASIALETGGIAGDMYDQLGGINGVDSGTAILHGTAAGLLDSLPFIHVMRQMGIAGVARKEIINSIPKEILKTALAEGGTEAAQTIIERHAIKWLDDSKDIFTDEGWKDIIDSAAAGFFGGGVMGTPGAVMGKRAKPEDDDEIVNKLTEDADGPDPTKVNINRYQAFLDRAKGANDKRHATTAAAKQAEEDKKQFGIFTQRLNLDDQFGAYDDQEFRLNSIRAARESARAKGGDQLSQAIAGGEGLLLSLRNSQRSIEPAPLEGELLDRQNALPNLPPQLPGNGFINGETQPAGLLGTPPNFYMGGPIAGNRNNGLDQQATVANRSDNLSPQLSMKSFADNLDWTATKARRTARLPVNLQDQRLLNESYRTALTELAHSAQTTVKSNPNSRSVDIHSDDLLTAIAKLGGVDRNELAKDGVDLEDMKKVRRGIRPVFSVKGRSLDDLAETLAEDGYLNSRDVNELDSKIRDMLAGQAHYSNARDPSLDIQSDIASEANQSYDGRKTHSTVLNATDFDAQPAAVQDAINKAMNGERLGSAQARIVNEALEAIKQARSGVIDRAKLFRDAGRTIRGELKRSQDLLNRPNAPIDAYSEAESTIDEQGISPEDAELMLMIAEAQDAGVPDHVIDYLEASTRNDQDFLSGIKREIKRAAPNGNRQSESETNNGGIRAGDQGRQDNPRGHDSRTQEESAGEGPALELATYTEKELKQQQAQREARQKAEAEAQAKEEAKAKAESQIDDFSLTGSERQADANPNQTDILDSEPNTPTTKQAGTLDNNNQDDELLNLFFSPNADSSAPTKHEPETELNPEVKQDLDAINDVISYLKHKTSEIESRPYSDNKSRVSFGHIDDDSEMGAGSRTRTIGDINEIKRNKVLRGFKSAINKLYEYKEKVAGGNATLESLPDTAEGFLWKELIGYKPGDITSSSGKAFATIASASTSAKLMKRRGKIGNYTIESVADGFVIREKRTESKAGIAIDPQRSTNRIQRTQDIQDTIKHAESAADLIPAALLGNRNFAPILNAIRETGLLQGIRVFPNVLQRNVGARFEISTLKGEPGTITDRTIQINASFISDNVSGHQHQDGVLKPVDFVLAETLTHELLHAATYSAIDKSIAMKSGISEETYTEYMADIRDIQDAIRVHLSENKSGLHDDIVRKLNHMADDAHEVITYGLTNTVIQQELKRIPGKKARTTWSELVKAIRKVFGLSTEHESLLDDIIAVSEKVMFALKNDSKKPIENEIKRAAPNGNRQSESETKKGGNSDSQSDSNNAAQSDSISDAQSDSKLGVNNDDDKRAGSRREGSETLGRVVAGDDAGTKGQRRMGEGDEAGRDQGSRDDSGADAAGVSSPRSGRGGAKSVHSIETGSPRPGRRTGKGAGRNGGGVSELGGADVQPGAIAPPSIPAANFVIDESVRLGQGGEVEKFNDNLNAIRIVKTLLREARRATPDEQRALARYVGWGGLANAFADADGNYKKGWEARGKALAELLSDKELAAARRSTRNAHYTSETIISAMYDAVKQLGHQGGLMLEPSAGTGNFIGLAPSGMDNRVIAVEYDPITAKIAEALYPQATVLHSGFQKVPLADGAFDLVIGNPPFGSESLRFPFKPWLNSHSIHNQFFIAAMDALKPNGVMAMVVSRYLLDAQSSDARKELARRGKLLGAIRLPDSAFKENARTEVVTDIIFMQRHDPETERLIRVGEEKLEGLPWLETVEVPDPQGGDAIRVNAYFAKNPHMILGSLERSGSMRVQNDVTVKLAPGELVQRLSEAVGRLPKNVVTATEGAIEAAKQRHEQMSAALQLALAGAEQGAILREDGQLVRVNEQETPEGGYELVKQVLTPASPWSSTLELDEHGRWYKSVPALDDKGDKVKDKGKNVYVREVYQDEKDIPSSLRLGESRHERLLVLAELRDTLNQQLQLEADDESKAKIEANRKVLAKQYKDFVQAHGPINANRNLLLLTEMPDGALLMALEKSYNPEEKEWTGEYKGKNKTKVYRKVSDESAVPADILAARMVFPYKKPAHAETPTDALAITLAEGGRVNLDRIAELLGMTPEEAKRVMYDDATTPLIFPDPESGLWETRDAYLSGNVARKLRAAKESGDRKAVEELVKVQPAPIKAENVAVQVSASWVPDNIYADFLTHLTGGRAQVKRLTATNSYSVSGDGTTAKAKEWGTERASVVKLVDDLLNNRQTRVIDYDSDGKAHPNQAETELANLKRDQIASEFNEWVFMDGLRRAQLVEIFNELFNTRVTRQHDGSHLILPGKVPDTVIKMRRHQLNAIWRGISERFILMDHAVGAGKTFTAIARAIERKRMGLSRKPMVVVPNHMVEQFAADALRLYPGANVLAAGKKGFEKKKRRKLFARIATGDWDLVIVPHSSFEFIPLSPETEERYLMIELEKAIAAVKEAEEQAREDDHNSFRKPFNVKEAERMKESVENRLDKLRTTRKDRLLTFEQMGVDDLTVDEAHEFKNLFYHTRTTGVRGMGNKAGSQKAFDLYNKVRVLADSPTGSVAFLTGTPISNSAVEMYTIMRYLAGKELQELGLDHFDAWRAQFVGISTKYEPTENGRLKEVNRLGRSWSNMKSLMDLYQGVADMVSNDDIKQTFAEDNPGKQYPLPKVKGGKRQSVVVKPTQAQEKILKQVLFDYDLLDSITNPEDRNRERLRLMDRARKLSLDARAANPGEKSPEEGGKLDAVADNVAALYKQWNDERGTQLVFLDRSVPSSKGDKKVIKAYGDLIAKRDQALADNDETAYRRIIERLDAYNPDEIESLRGAQSGGWNAYEQIKQNLIKRGIPEKEIRFIQEANTDQQKQELFDAVNEGSVRVLIGSTPRMGAGTNVQKRLVGLHHVDVTWKPSDIEQREGRIIRQGNLIGFDKHGNIIRPDFEVSILAYVTERTMDAKMWDLNSTKLAMINAIRQYNGEFTMEFDDSESDAVNMEEIAALATGDPKMLERVTLKGEIDKLMLLERAHRRKQWGYADALREYERIIETYPDRIHAMQENIGRLQDAIASVEARSLARSVTVQGKNIHLRFDAEREIKGWIDAQQAGNPKARYSVKVNGKNLSSRVEIDKIIQSAFGDQGFEVLIGKREYISALDAGREIGAKLSSLAKGLADGDQSRSVAVGVMYGMTLEVDVMRDGNYFASLSLTDKAGAVVVSTEVSARNEPEYSPALIKNALSTLVSEVYSRSNVANLDRLNRALENAKKELPETKEKYGKPFDKAAELQEKRDRLAALTSELASEKVSAKAEEAQDEAVTQASVGSLVDADKPSFTAIARDELEQAIAPVLRQTGQTVKIVDSYHELPPAARAKVAKLGGLAWDFIWGRLKGVRLSLDAGEVPKLVPGVYHEGTYYAIREFTPNAEVSARTALHELVGHKGVNRVLGDEAGKIFRQIARSMPDAMREELKARYNLKDTDADLAELGSEYVAKLSEEDARPTTVQFVVAKIRHILRKLFPKLSWNKADALYLIERGRKALEKNSAEMDARETAAMESFDKAEGLANATPFSQSISDILSKQSDTAKDKVLDALLDNKFAEGFKKSSLALLTLRQLGDVAKKILPQINTYVGVVHEMLTDRNQMAEQAANIVDAWQAWAAKNRKEADKLADLMHAATIDGVDPSLAFESMTDNITKRIGLKEDRIAVIERKDRSTSGDGTAALMNEKKKIENEIKELKKDLLAEPGRRKRHAALVPEWNTLTPEAKQFYKKARDEYGKQNERMLKILQARIQGVDLNGTTIDGATKKRLLAELRLEFEAQRIQVYFPLSRFGKYYLDTQDKDGKRVYLMFETEREQQRVMKEMEKQGYDVSKHGHMLDKRREESASLSFIKELSDSIDNLAGYDVDEKDTIRDSIYQVYLRHLPDRSIRKAHIHRKKVSGYSTDAIRAFADTMMKNAYQLARLQRMDELSGLMTEMEQAAGPKSSPGNAKGIFYNEMQKRHEWVMNPKHSAIAHKLTGLGFIWMLGVSPAAAAINLTQTPVVAGPVLASKYGKGAWSELLRASRLFNVKSGSMLEKLTDQKERDAFNRWRDMGLLDSTRAHDLAGIAEHGGYEYSPTQHKIMTGISAIFHRAEQFNREVTALAAFRLAMKKHNDYEQAVKEAAELTWDSHFDYSNVNRARFMQSGFMKVATQFKQYSQNITYYMLRNLHQMIKGESAEVKKQARQQLLGTLAMTGLIGGINALPLWALYAVANAIFGDDDEPYDAQTELYTYLSDTLGKDMADEIIYGAGGAGVSPRISLSGLWFRDSNRELEGEDAWSFYAQQAVGPVLGGIVPGFFEGMRKAGDGEYARAFENFVPKFVKDAAKTVRYFREGALNTKGDELKAEEDFSTVDLVLQLSGFADSDVSKQYAENAAIKGYERHILERRKRLMTKYYLAQKDGDSGEKLEVQQMIARFNKRWPEIRIDNKALRNSIKSRERARDNAQHGININPKLEQSLSRIDWAN